VSRVLLLGQGPDGHPPETHEYVAGMRLLGKVLQGGVPGLEVEVVSADGAWDEGPAKLRRADAAVLFLSQGAKWIHEEPRRLEALAQLAARGGGLITLHWGMGTREAEYIDGFLKLFGGCHGGPDRKFQVLETRVEIADPAHPVVSGLRPFRVHEEFYYRLKFVPADRAFTPLLKAEIDGQWETVAWAWERSDGGRSFGFSGAHFHKNWELEEYRRLMANAVVWSLKRPLPAEGLDVRVSPEDLKVQ
jgi:type 1 glutamine amidotransferase